MQPLISAYSSTIKGSPFSASSYMYLLSLLPETCYLIFKASQHCCWNNCYQYASDICFHTETLFSLFCVYTCAPATEQELIIYPAHVIALQSIWVLSWRRGPRHPDVSIPSQPNRPPRSNLRMTTLEKQNWRVSRREVKISFQLLSGWLDKKKLGFFSCSAAVSWGVEMVFWFVTI